MYLIIYNECPSVNDENWVINWRIEKNLEKVYKFTIKNAKYEFLDLYKINNIIDLNLLKKYKKNREELR